MRRLLAALAVIFAIQAWCFRTYALREITWAYPGSYDQVAYLANSYTAFAGMQRYGLVPGSAAYLAEPRPTGWLMPYEAALLYRVAGPSRLTALSIHLVHLFLFEAALALTLYWLSQSAAVALIGVGLYLCTLSRFLITGGWMDFRMECSALSVFGIVLCLAIRSDSFRDTRWAAITGLVAAYLICFRFITAVYLAGIFLAMFVWFLWRGRHALKGLLIAGGVAAAIAVPVLLINQSAIRGYYLPSHVVGGEKYVRAAEQGITNALDNLSYYPRILFERHLALAVFPVAALAVLLLPWLLRRRRRSTAESRQIPALAVAFLVVPLFILTLDTTKAEQVAGILIPGLLWLFLLPLLRYPLPRWPLYALTVFVLSGWLLREHEWLNRHASFWYARADVEQVVSLNHDLAGLADAQSLPEPLLTTNQIVDFLSADMLTVLAYEHSQHLIRPRSAIFLGVMAIPKDNVLDGITRSDFAILSTYPGPVPPPAYPFNLANKEHAPEVLAWARSRMHQVREYQIAGQPFLLFSRR